MAWVHNNVVLPLVEPHRHSRLGKRLKDLDEFERLPETKQRAVQAGAISELLTHAYETTPYYRRLFDEVGFHPSAWKAGDPIPVPTLTREMLRANEVELRSRRHPVEDLHAAATGGTTSTPVRLWRDTEALRKKTALQYHLNRIAGFDQGDSIVMIWGAERDLDLNPTWRQRLYEERVMKRFASPAGQVGDEVFERFLKTLNKRRPKVLFGFGLTLAKFAEYVLVHNLKAHQPAVIITTAEAISDVDRDFITRAFGCPPTDMYGSRDVGTIGFECKAHTGLHFHPAGCFLEFEYAGMTQDGPMHKLIVTDLMNYGMPMIRYDTGDCVILADTCECGKWYPKIKMLLGRVSDNVLMHDGTEVPGIIFAARMTLMKETFQFITQVQIVQTKVGALTVNYAAQGDETSIDADLGRLRALINDIIKEPIQLTFVRLPEILREQSGKLRLCISQVKRDEVLQAR